MFEFVNDKTLAEYEAFNAGHPYGHFMQSKKWANLKKKEDEIFLKIIIGEAPLSAFDTFVEEWKAEGGDEITAEVQAEVEK